VQEVQIVDAPQALSYATAIAMATLFVNAIDFCVAFGIGIDHV
jgi:hypothetical protein